MKKIKFLLAIFISIMPFSFIRVFLYKNLFKYKINNSKIGFGTIIDIDSCILNDTNIGIFNLFTGPFSLKMDLESIIGVGNVFRCGKWVTEAQFESMKFKRSLQIGKEVSIDNKHYFDIAGLIKIGDKSFISGNGSQFWTHGGDKIDNDIIVGKQCYIGSGVKFAPGSQVSNNTIVAMGSIITKKFKQENSLISPPSMRVLKFEATTNHIFNN